jgi:hypothetical protein
MKVAQDRLEAFEDMSNEFGNFVLCICSLSNLDVEIEGPLPLRAQWSATHEPSIFGNIVKRDGDDIALLPEDCRGRLDEQRGNIH